MEKVPTTSEIVDEYQSDEDNISCQSCNSLRKRIKSLQKTISWYKRSKAQFKKKAQKLELENKSSIVNLPSTSTAGFTEADANVDSDECGSECSDGELSMDFSSHEESSEPAEDIEHVTKNTVRWVNNN